MRLLWAACSVKAEGCLPCSSCRPAAPLLRIAAWLHSLQLSSSCGSPRSHPQPAPFSTTTVCLQTSGRPRAGSTRRTAAAAAATATSCTSAPCRASCASRCGQWGRRLLALLSRAQQLLAPILLLIVGSPHPTHPNPAPAQPFSYPPSPKPPLYLDTLPLTPTLPPPPALCPQLFGRYKGGTGGSTKFHDGSYARWAAGSCMYSIL